MSLPSPLVAFGLYSNLPTKSHCLHLALSRVYNKLATTALLAHACLAEAVLGPQQTQMSEPYLVLVSTLRYDKVKRLGPTMAIKSSTYPEAHWSRGLSNNWLLVDSIPHDTSPFA